MDERSGAEHLVIQTAFLGDLLLSVPLFKHLKRLRPSDRLTVLARKGLGDFLSRSGLVDEVIEADKASAESWREAEQNLKARRFDWLICPHESPRSARLAFHLEARHKVGYRRFWNLLVFGDRIERPMELPEALRQLALLEPIEDGWSERLADFARTQSAAGGQASGGKLNPVPDWADMRIPALVACRESRQLSPRAQAIADRIGLNGTREFVFLAPGSVWPTKMWTADGYAAIARRALERGFGVAIMGAPAEREVCARIAAAAPGAVSIAGEPTLFESAELLAQARLLFCNDSGAMHIASAAGVPAVSVFGPTVLELGYRPWSDRASVVQVPRAELTCRPCGKHGAKVCPIGTHACMVRVTADEVWAAARALDPEL